MLRTFAAILSTLALLAAPAGLQADGGLIDPDGLTSIHEAQRAMTDPDGFTARPGSRRPSADRPTAVWAEDGGLIDPNGFTARPEGQGPATGRDGLTSIHEAQGAMIAPDGLTVSGLFDLVLDRLRGLVPGI